MIIMELIFRIVIIIIIIIIKIRQRRLLHLKIRRIQVFNVHIVNIN